MRCGEMERRQHLKEVDLFSAVGLKGREAC